jgi:LPXTG-motif cell wall-anchored protein
VVIAADELEFFELGDTFATERLDVDCQRAPAGRAVPRLDVGAGALAATGANGLALPIAGMMLLASGGVLTLLGRRDQGPAS